MTGVIKNVDLSNRYIYMCSSPVVAKSFKETLADMKFDINKFKCESA